MANRLTGGSPRPSDRNFGLVSGFVFKLTREQTGLSQEALAERLGADKATIQGWESGRRPLAAVQFGRFKVVTRTLLSAGADPASLTLLNDALEADYVDAAPTAQERTCLAVLPC